METKNIILADYSNTITVSCHTFTETVMTLGANEEENTAILRSLNVLLESIRSQVVNIQNVIDHYND